MMPLTPWVRRLLVANVVVHFLVASNPALSLLLRFEPWTFFSEPWTGITYQFVHAGFMHLAFNMLGLYFFGPRLEERIGGGHFLAMYLGAGFAGALLSLPMGAPMVGASGAVFGILAAYAVIWPRTTIYFFAILPVEAWALALIMVGASLYFGLTGGGNIAHFAHLGGLVFGFAYLKVWEWRKGSAKREFQKKLEVRPEVGGGVADALAGDGNVLRRWEAIDTDELHELNREEVVLLLEKARTKGVRSLTQSERQFMERMARA